jgi:hypothetical protein
MAARMHVRLVTQCCEAWCADGNLAGCNQEGAKARQVLEQFLASHPEAADATLINILAELYMADEDWRAASKLIAETSDHLSTEGEVPIDLQVQADTVHNPCSSKNQFRNVT